MNMKISEFKRNFSGGGARTNLYEVEIEFPVYAGGQAETRKGTFLIKAATLPPSTLGIIEVGHRGRKLKLAGDRTFEEWSITVWNDTAFDLRDAFERWSNAINGHASNEGFENPDDYMSYAVVHQLNRKNERIKSYLLKDVWPSNVGAISLSSEDNDVIEEFEVSLQYSEWEARTTS
jgi:hypothetical protein